ncbi:MAG: SPOR domain-containing protein [Chryseobacterium sp.]|nr:SPOR domain-containing protein [Chryseobacterium sp.]
MKSFKQIFLFFGFFGFIMITAQQVVKIDTISGNTLKITMNQKISDLLQNTEEKCNTSSKNTDSDNLINDYNSTPKINIPERTMSTAEACRKNPRIMGFKILIATVKSNEDAKQVGLYFRGKFPTMKVEIDASLRPNYKIMAGSYFSRQTASADFSNVKRSFKEARLISYRVFCVEAK